MKYILMLALVAVICLGCEQSDAPKDPAADASTDAAVIADAAKADAGNKTDAEAVPTVDAGKD
jgi:hypothetical protein